MRLQRAASRLPRIPVTPAGRPRGFTLVELLVVLVIIGILAALLLPTIGAAMRKARVNQVQQEITLLDTALTEFKSRYGVFPPSRICLHENPINGLQYGKHTGQFATLLNHVDQRTVQFLKRMWPKFSPVNPAVAGLNVYDYNGNGQSDQFLVLNGSECLVFFLGGMPQPLMPDNQGGENLVGLVGGNLTQVTTRGFEGFSRVPQLPFGRSAIDTSGNNGNAALAVGATQRFAAMFQFEPSRLSDVDVDGFWEYYDPIQEPALAGGFDPAVSAHPYAYFSGYDGQGYNWVKTNTLNVVGQCQNVVPTYDGAWLDLSAGLPRGLLWPLSINPGSAPTLTKWWNERSYQIISPGIADGLIGTGTRPDCAGLANAVAVFNPDAGNASISAEMEDNITNFSGGQLSDVQ